MDIAEFAALDLLFLVIAAALLLSEKRDWSWRTVAVRLGLERPASIRKLLADTVQLSIVLLGIAWITSSLITAFFPADLANVENLAHALADAGPLVLVYLFLVRVATEELLFRGALVPRIGILPSALVFGIGHITYASIAQVVGALVAGLVLGAYFFERKSLWPPFFAHLLYNAIALGASIG